MSKENVAIAVAAPPPTVEEKVRNAAEEGNIEALYRLIKDKADLLKDFDQKEFVNTPLHIAAAAGRTEFAMELMCLKPSFLTKLNHDGWSPIHLAVLNHHTKTALSLLKFDKSLPRLKGKNCYTPLHCVVKEGVHLDVLKNFLKACPECIHDVTSHDETALHLASRHNNLEALRFMLQWLWIADDYSVSHITEIVNSKNKHGDTLLLMAASNKQPKIVKLVLQRNNVISIDLKATNSEGSTVLSILQEENQPESLSILQGENQAEIKECVKMLRGQNWSWHVEAFSRCCFRRFGDMAYEIRNMSENKTNALLVATVLILTTTYQAALSPPGGIFQASSDLPQRNTTSFQTHSAGGHNTSSSTPWWPHPFYKFKRRPFTPGSSVLSTGHFLGFFIPNIGAFCVSFFVTSFALLNILPNSLSFILVLSLTMLLGCLLVSAVLITSPNSQSLSVMVEYVFILSYYVVLVIVTVVIFKLYRRIWIRRITRSINQQ